MGVREVMEVGEVVRSCSGNGGGGVGDMVGEVVGVVWGRLSEVGELCERWNGEEGRIFRS